MMVREWVNSEEKSIVYTHFDGTFLDVFLFLRTPKLIGSVTEEAYSAPGSLQNSDEECLTFWLKQQTLDQT